MIINLITYAFNHPKEKCVLQNKQKRFNVISGNADDETNEKTTIVKKRSTQQQQQQEKKIRGVIMP